MSKILFTLWSLLCLGFAVNTAFGMLESYTSQENAVTPTDTIKQAEAAIIQQVETPEIQVIAPKSEYTEIDCSGADGHRIELYYNQNATNPTYDEAKAFICKDRTNEIEYNLDSYSCGDFAETVQHNAEKAGYKCGWVYIKFNAEGEAHACNVFNTTDKGLIFFDCTGSESFAAPNGDSEVKLENGTPYTPTPFSESVTCETMGITKYYQIYWSE